MSISRKVIALIAAVLLIVVGAVIGARLRGHQARRRVQPAYPSFPIPLDWHALPTAPPTGTATFCIHQTECFRVDGNGYPYGTPTWDGNASPGVRGMT